MVIQKENIPKKDMYVFFSIYRNLKNALTKFIDIKRDLHYFILYPLVFKLSSLIPFNKKLLLFANDQLNYIPDAL